MTFLDQIESWDHWLLLKVNSLNSPFLDEIMWFVSAPYFGIPFYLHPLDKTLLGRANLYRTIFRSTKVVTIPKINKFFECGEDQLTIGDFSIRVIPTPGHTKGSVCLLLGNLLFSGDTLFKGRIGRTDFPESNFKEIQQSLKNLLTLPPDTIVYPGHGSNTSIGNEINNISEIISA